MDVIRCEEAALFGFSRIPKVLGIANADTSCTHILSRHVLTFEVTSSSLNLILFAVYEGGQYEVILKNSYVGMGHLQLLVCMKKYFSSEFKKDFNIDIDESSDLVKNLHEQCEQEIFESSFVHKSHAEINMKFTLKDGHISMPPSQSTSILTSSPIHVSPAEKGVSFSFIAT